MDRRARTGRRATSWRIGIAALAVAVFAAWLLWPRDPAPEAPRVASAAEDAHAQPATAPKDVSTSPVVRADANAPENATPATTPAFAFECTLTARDEYNLPVQAWAELGPADGAVLPYSSGFEQVALDRRYRWSASSSTGMVLVETGLLRRVPLRASQPAQIAVGACLSPPSPKTNEPVEMGPGDQLERVFGPRIAPTVAFLNASTGVTGGSEIGVNGPGHFGLFGSPPKYGVLRGMVLTPLGATATDFTVRMNHLHAATGGNGTFAFERHLVGKYRVEAGSIDGSTLQTEVTINEGSTSVILQLVANPAARGRVVTTGGRPIPNARLVWSTDDRDFNDHACTRDDGSFVVPARHAGTGSLWACAPGNGARWPAAACTAQTDVPTDLVVDPATCRSRLQLTTPRLADLPLRTVSARLWQQSSGYGMTLVCTRANENGCEFAAIDLPAGHYQLELLAPAFGVVDGGAFWCDGAHDVDLGRIALPPLCAVTVELPPGTPEPSAFEFVRVGSAFPSRLHTELGIAATHRLAAGDYELWWRHGANAAPQSLAFTIPRGATALPLRLTAR
jgi:hypothetical protein